MRFPPRKFVSTRGPTRGNDLFRQKPRIASFLGKFVSALYHTPPGAPGNVSFRQPGERLRTENLTWSEAAMRRMDLKTKRKRRRIRNKRLRHLKPRRRQWKIQ